MSESPPQPEPPAADAPHRQAIAAAEAHRVGLETVQQAAQALNARNQRWEAIRRTAEVVRDQARSVESIGRAARALQSRLQRVEKLRRVAGADDELVRRLHRLDALRLDALTEAITASLAADALQAADPQPLNQHELLAVAGIEIDEDQPTDPEHLLEPAPLNRLSDAAGRAEQPGLRLALLQLTIGLVGLFIDRLLDRSPGRHDGTPLREAEAVRAVRKHVRQNFSGTGSLRSGRVVARQSLALHREPNAAAPVVEKLPLGTVVGLLAKRKHWAHVRCAAPGQSGSDDEPVEGWVRSKYLKPLSR